MEILHATDATFEELIVKSPKPVLVDFWAEWCAPCRALAPLVKEIAEEYADRLQVAKVDVDANQAITAQYSIRAMPTLLFFKDGAVAGSLVGLQPRRKITEQIEQLFT